MSKEHKLVIEEVFSISSPVAPSRVFISRGLSNPYELNIGLFNLQGRKLEIYQSDIRQLRSFNKVLELNQVIDAV